MNRSFRRCRLSRRVEAKGACVQRYTIRCTVNDVDAFGFCIKKEGNRQYVIIIEAMHYQRKNKRCYVLDFTGFSTNINKSQELVLTLPVVSHLLILTPCHLNDLDQNKQYLQRRARSYHANHLTSVIRQRLPCQSLDGRPFLPTSRPLCISEITLNQV